MKTVLLGIGSPFKSKKGFDCQSIGVISEYSAREKGAGCVGKKVETVWVPEDQIGKIPGAWIDKEIKLNYDISSGRAYLQSIELAK